VNVSGTLFMKDQKSNMNQNFKMLNEQITDTRNKK